jgi:hypothetical protein
LRRNPFVSPLEQGANGSSGADAGRASNAELKLKGILLSGGQPLVNFGGQIMAPGDEVAGYRVQSQRPDHHDVIVFRAGGLDECGI